MAQVLADSVIVKKGCVLGVLVLLPPASLSLSGKVTADVCLPRETSLPDSSYPEQTPAWHSLRGVQGGPHFWASPCASGLAGTSQGDKTELKRSGLLLGLPSTEHVTPTQLLHPAVPLGLLLPRSRGQQSQ